MLKSLSKINSQPGKRLGRGISAGQGKTAGRGTKGQKSRSGYNLPRKFEGGQMPFSMRMPKMKGFKSRFEEAVIITLDQISANFKQGETVSLKALQDKKLVALNVKKVKVLNNGKLTVSVNLEVPYSKSIVVPTAKAEKKVEEKPLVVLAKTRKTTAPKSKS